MVLSFLHLFIISLNDTLAKNYVCTISRTYSFEVLHKNWECFKIESVDSTSIKGRLCNAATKLASTFRSVTHTEVSPDSVRQPLVTLQGVFTQDWRSLFACTTASYIVLQMLCNYLKWWTLVNVRDICKICFSLHNLPMQPSRLWKTAYQKYKWTNAQYKIQVFFFCKISIIFWLVLSDFIERHVAGMWPSLMCTSALIKLCAIYQQQTNSSLSPVTSAENIQWGHIHDSHVLSVETQVHNFIQFLYNWFNIKNNKRLKSKSYLPSYATLYIFK